MSAGARSIRNSSRRDKNRRFRVKTRVMRSKSLVFVMILAGFIGCKSANYSFWNKLGYEKRDILVSRVEKAKKSQEAAKEQFKTTLQRFQELTNFQGGE